MDLKLQTLDGRFVTLEPMGEHHREALRPAAQEEELWTLTSLRGDGAHFDSWFDAMLAGQTRGNQISHIVRRKADNAVVGHSAFLEIVPAHRKVEIGWTWYSADARGGAVNPDCKRLLLGRAFACGAHRVELKTHFRNARSRAAMTKMGATEEGVLRENILCWTGEWRDSIYFSVLENEWPGVRQGLERCLDAYD